jgi:hypothetical protein
VSRASIRISLCLGLQDVYLEQYPDIFRGGAWKLILLWRQLDYTKYSTTTLAAHNPVNAEEEQSLAATDPQKPEFETVGCVAVDMHGSCAAATSTGGLVNKMVGRIGSSVHCFLSVTPIPFCFL